jgi:hypothetical protein
MAILKEAPAGANVLDLGAARAARAEARAATGAVDPVIKLTAGFVPIKPEFDVTVAELLVGGKIREALAALLVDPADVDSLISEGISAQDLNAIVAFVGASVGESQASSTL